MPKGWVYVDDNVEKIRVQEARNDRETARLQKEGLLFAKLEAEKVTTAPHSFKNERKAMRSSQRIKSETNGHRSKANSGALKKKPTSIYSGK
jgi:histone-lysine N-methyltransferase ASH1L